MKTVMKKLLSVMLVAILLVSAVPFQASAAEVDSYEDAKLTVTVFNQEGNQIGEHYFGAGTYTEDELFAACYTGEHDGYRFRGMSGSITVDDNSNESIMLIVNVVEVPEEEELVTLTVVFNTGRPMEEDKISFKVFNGANILDALKEYGVSVPSYADHKFVGWSFMATADASEDVVTIYSTVNGDTTIFADWEKISDDDDDEDEVIYDAFLKIYTNGKTSSAAKTIDLDFYSIDGEITRDEVEAAVKKYYKAANSDGMSFFGLFTSATWNNGKYDTDDAVYSVDLDADKTTYIYVMVKNATAISTNTGSNSNSNADKTNPQTGDGIVMALAAMMSTGGAALALGKKKFF